MAHNRSQALIGPDVRFGSLAEVEVADADFCFTPESGHPADITASPKSAKDGPRASQP
jgi:hypothetical protein